MIAVRVTLLNDDGDRLVLVAEDETVDSAVAAAELLAAHRTGDDSYVMSDWSAA